MWVEHILRAVEADENAKSLFYLKDGRELEKLLDTIRPERPGFLTWGEFVELMFNHKRKAKPPKEEETKKSPPKSQIEAEQVWGEENIHSRAITAEDYKKQLLDKQKKTKKSRDPEESKITVPKPFNFAQHDQKKLEKKRRQQKLVAEKAKEPPPSTKPFVANPIPVTTLLPRYEMIRAQEEARRMEVKQNSYAITRAREKPFSFYAKDNQKYLKKRLDPEEEPTGEKPFKANPVPLSAAVQIFDQMQRKRELARDERIKKRAEVLMAESKLPPRMEMHKGEESKKKKPEEPSYSFRPEPARELPDFKKQQEEFQAALEKHKQSKQLTVVEPFEFREVKVRCTQAEAADRNGRASWSSSMRRIRYRKSCFHVCTRTSRVHWRPRA